MTQNTTSTSADPDHRVLAAQRLNQQGAYCLETGRYDKAISNFVKGMEYSKQQDKNKACQCNECTVDACIRYSHGLVVKQKEQQWQEMGHTTTATQNDYDNNDDNEWRLLSNQSSDDTGGYKYSLYQQPIFISPKSFGHSMGIALPKIITFNLALAYHLKALKTQIYDEHEDDEEYQHFQLAIKLYQLIYKNEIKKNGSIFMALVAANNLVGIYQRMQRNYKKQQQFLRFVISTVMILVHDSATSPQNNNNNTSKAKEHCKMELQGFLQNAFSLTAHLQCAGAA